MNEYDLSEREQQVHALMCAGCKLNEIARLLFITRSTAKSYWRRVNAKLRAKQSAELCGND
jgi:DNA-binding CsgD family transcriptional regulator